jgi:hypothetical protein
MTETTETATITEEILRVEFPIEIGIVGAPGSGKSQLIDTFLETSAEWFADQGCCGGIHLHTVGNAGSLIENNFDQAMGPYGGYRDNLWGIFERLSQEKTLRNQGKSFIANGTVIDSLAHTGVNLETVMLGAQNSGLITPQTQVELQKVQMATEVTKALFFDILQYKFVFYLPLPPQIEVPGQEHDEERRYGDKIDNAIQAIFGGLGMRIQALDQPTMEEKAQEMLDTIKRIMEDGVKVADLSQSVEEADIPGHVAQTDSVDPVEFGQVVSEVLDQPCGCEETVGGEE